MRLFQFKPLQKVKLIAFTLMYRKHTLIKLLTELGMTLLMLRSIVVQVRQHHSVSNVDILQQSMKIVLVPGDVLDVYIFNTRISVLTKIYFFAFARGLICFEFF